MTGLTRNVLLTVLALACLAPGRALGARKDAFEIAPGARTISEEEKAIEANPAAGIEHAVILLEETERNDALGTLKRNSYHLRAKILSNEGRDLANVEIPLLSKESSIKTWWGRTLLPDGTVLDLLEADLQVQTAMQKGLRHEARVYKGILPGVVPGSVIDYGYVVRDTEEGAYRTVPLQGAYFTKELRYRWVPAPPGRMMMSSCNLSHNESLDVSAVYEKQAFVVHAKDMPPVVEEPWMPPEKDVRAAATFYFTLYSRSADDFWDYYAGIEEDALEAFLVENMPIRQWEKSVTIPGGDDLDSKLRFVYDWIATHIRNTSLLGLEDLEAADPDAKAAKSARSVLDAGEGTTRQIDSLFAGIARDLGAEAYLVLAADRTDHQWDPSLLTWGEQFNDSLVAVRGPEDPPGQVTMVDPGSGLPYGEIPWWLSDTMGLLVAPKSGKKIIIRGTGARRAVSQTVVSVTFDETEQAVRAAWTTRGEGQQGLREQRALRALAPEPRGKRIAGMCGAGESLQVERAEMPELDDPLSPLHLECEGTFLATYPPDDVDLYAVSFTGPWLVEAPLLTAAKRVHLLIFPFPRTDLTTLKLAAPPGMRPRTPPKPARIASPFGNYFLNVSATEKGFEIQRSFTLLRHIVKPEDYAAFKKFTDQVHGADATRLEFERVPEDSR